MEGKLYVFGQNPPLIQFCRKLQLIQPLACGSTLEICTSAEFSINLVLAEIMFYFHLQCWQLA